MKITAANSSFIEKEDLLTSNRSTDKIDTSLLIEELRREYHRTGQQVEVDFRSLVQWIRIGDQLTHQIHPYPAKLLPNIAHFFIRASNLNKHHRYVLDPFCGSGTVALEASLAGYVPYVADANPLALLITKVKTTPYEIDALQETSKKIIARAARLRTAPVISIVNDHLWYKPERKRQLEILLRAVMETEDELERDFFRVCFSVTARRLSLADPAISVPVRLKTKERFENTVNEKIESRLRWIEEASSLAEFLKVCDANINRVKETNSLFERRQIALEVGTDARQLKMPHTQNVCQMESNSIPFVITSPPYGSAQKYIRATSLSLNWLGFATPNELASLEGKTIGREHLPLYRNDAILESLPDEYERLLHDIQRKNENRARITRQYLGEMRLALVEMARVISQNGRIVLVLGNNQVCGHLLHNDKYVVKTLESCGFSLELSLIDQIKSRGLMTKRHKTSSVISRETVLIFKKNS